MNDSNKHHITEERKLIILNDRVDVVSGRMADALAWAEKIRAASKKAGFVGEKHWLLRSISSASRFSFATQFASLADFEQKFKFLQDPAVHTLVKEMATGGWLVNFDRSFSQILIED